MKKEVLTKPSTIRILDVPIFDGTIEDATEIIIHQIREGIKQNHCISATGAHGLVNTKRDKGFKKMLEKFYINLPDGMPGVWIGRLKGAKRIDRCYGPDFFELMMRETAGENIKHYFCGGKEGIAEALSKVCAEKFDNHQVLGTHCPPFRPMTYKEIVSLCSEIDRLETNVLWIGISTPKQEKLAYQLSKYLNVDFIITVGAAFDFHLGMVKQAPKFVQRSGLEWFFRLCIEPKRLWKRYINTVPLFILYNVIHFLNFKKNGI